MDLDWGINNRVNFNLALMVIWIDWLDDNQENVFEKNQASINILAYRLRIFV